MKILRLTVLALAWGGYVDGGKGPDLTDFVKTREYTEVDSDIQDRLKATGLTQTQLEADLARYNLKLDDMRAFSADVR